MSTSATAIYSDLELIRQQAPLVHNITNYVVMQQTANALCAIGASPLMAHAMEELPDIISLSQALVINMGTLDAAWIASAKQALLLAEQKKIPIIFDPVGAGASQLRTQTASALLEAGHISLLRANAGEILALAGMSMTSKGVDSRYESESACEAARALQERYGCVIVISGARDYIIAPSKNHCIENGVPLMTKVTGMGCSTTALCGAFAAINANLVSAAIHAMAVAGIAGEIAFQTAKAPGSFAVKWLDALYEMTIADIDAKLNDSAMV